MLIVENVIHRLGLQHPQRNSTGEDEKAEQGQQSDQKGPQNHMCTGDYTTQGEVGWSVLRNTDHVAEAISASKT